MDLSPDDDNFQGRLLHQAALWDNVELLQELIASGADVDARDANQRSALHAAALAERSRCLAALCAAGCDVNARSDDATGGKTALHISAERGHVSNVATLVAGGADLALPDARGDTPLALAERERHRRTAHVLREARDALERTRLAQHAELRELVSRGDTQQLRQRLQALGPVAGLVANLAPGGASTLLYVASEAGLTSAVSALLEAGADGRAHPVTAYSPLYIASYHAHQDIARLLLAHFPQAPQQETVEKWLPLHAACIGGHASIVTLLLEYPYPESVLNTYTDVSGQWQYRAAFDVNARDVSGQSALYVACTLGNLAVVDALLAYTVSAERCRSDTQTEPTAPAAPAHVLSPVRSGISLGIHAIVSKLTGSSNKHDPQDPSPRIRPVRVDSARGCDSCISAAARGGHLRVVRRLLDAGAAPHAPAQPPHTQMSEPRERRRSRSASASSRASTYSRASGSPSPCATTAESPWTALALAASLKHVQVAQLLVSRGAGDPHCAALRQCAQNNLTELMASILATKAYPDPDYKLNKSVVSESVFSSREGDPSLTYSSLCPSTPVMITWRELGCQLATIRMSWILSGVLRVNSRVSRTPGALAALTRADISNNELRTLPPDLFALVSLRYLNAAQNKLERLPTLADPFEDEIDSKGRRIKKKKSRPEVYSAPVLQELYLQDNRLEELPPELFSLPSLTTLDVSNNKLRALPGRMWAAPALTDLSAALNHLKDLPTHCQDEQSPTQAMSPSEPCHSASPSAARSQFNFTSQHTSSSRSPSIERSESSEALEDDDQIPTLGNRAGNAVPGPARRAHIWRGVTLSSPAPSPASCALASLNLAHNQLARVPPALACRAPNLLTLNLAYNSLRSMSYVTSYPTSLRQLDLSHNEITCWPSLPQLDKLSSSPAGALACYCPGGGVRARPRSGGSVRAQLLSAACPARRHLRLEALRTLILSNNLLTRIQLTTDDDGETTRDDNDRDDDEDWGAGSSLKGRLLFPLLSMLDVSCNMLRAVPPAIHELTNLAVFNISANKDITELPPQMGLLSRLWNLNTVGCSLEEPLRSMVRSGRYKSMDIVGYLLSVLQEARPYARCKLMLVGLQGIGKTSLLECLRQESSIQHRRKPTDHWARRMGNKSSRKNMSTVGVDIGTWVYEKSRSTRGPITFRTWDFGGQQEYYATHQYFLSRRSLYLVVWKVTQGRRGLAAALDWLRSIQARAPGSPVIMVATHYDQVANSNLPESESPESLQRVIRQSMMAAVDADKLGLPRVLDSVEVSCSTRHNIRLLADIIYSVAYSVKPPGSKEPMLEQKIPGTYLALEECVTSLAADLTEPVLRHDQYKQLVAQYMQQKNLRMFRDEAELHQATMFLHENGVLLHYDDATLKELYFLRPQWLCDILAHVVTVREINPFAHNGVMKIEDLAHVFKASPALSRGEEASSLGVSLLNKFELALCWDARVLLVPPLLPHAEPHAPQVCLKSRSWSVSRRWPAAAGGGALTYSDAPRGTDSPTLIQDGSSVVCVSSRACAPPLRRLVLLSYVPRGFWPRLVTRVLADQTLAQAVPALYRPPAEVELDDSIAKDLELNWGWKLWLRGMKLCSGPLTLLSLRELPAVRDAALDAPPYECDEEHPYANCRIRVKQEGVWCSLDVSSSACVELLLPAHVCVLRREDGAPIAGYQSLSLEPNPEILAKILALISDHVDLLLEDWYPSLGTRFVHTSEGRCLITRVVPCPACLRDVTQQQQPQQLLLDHEQAFNRLELGERRPRLSEESRASDGDSGVGAESNASSRLPSVEGVVSREPALVHGWPVEACVLAACTHRAPACPKHTRLRLPDIAPDTLLLDVPEPLRARWEHISRGSVAGRGAFGTVLTATWRPPGQPTRQVALKALQPVAPPTTHDVQAYQLYKAAQSRWERDPSSGACRAYCALRQELSILLQLRHAHVAPLTAVCCAPLALLLALAPQGALDGVLRQYRGCGVRVTPRALRALATQIARALEYLHSCRILYRDLKSENVLVWSMPTPQDAAAAERSPAPIDVHVKLGDYGISRLAPPSGTKGFGGTEGFMAPEIMRYNGEEEYNEKVDCFSYGMLLYEILTLRQPFEGHEAVKEAVLDGARPTLTPKDVRSPWCPLDTMRACWSPAPAARPSAAALVAIATAPEYSTLQDAAQAGPAAAAASAPILAVPDEDTGGWEVWHAGGAGAAHALLATPSAFVQQHTIRIPNDGAESVSVTAMCRVGANMWLGDSAGRVLVYSVSTCSLLWSVVMHEAVGGGRSPVSALQPLPALGRVALALQCGRLFLVTSSRPEAEGSFVVTELGTATELCCLAVVPGVNCVEVWSGGLGVWWYGVRAGGVRAAGRAGAAQVRLLAPDKHQPYVFSYEDPGVSICQWSVVTHTQSARLDCSRLVPCSESLQSAAVDDHLADRNCTLTSLCCVDGRVYAGTSRGSIVVADADTLRPLTVFRPYHHQVMSMVPLLPHKGLPSGSPSMLATFGDGYRPLLQRFAPQQNNSNQTQYDGNYCILWRAERWLPD